MIKAISFISFILLSFTLLGSQEKYEEANELYANESYDSALVVYESILEEGQYSYVVFYNLGNTYFRTNQLGKAILYWEKARKIKPSDAQVIENLNYAYNLAKDKFEVDIKSVGFVKAFVYEKSPNFWSILSIIIALFLGISLYLFFVSKNDTTHQISFYVSIVGFICLVTFVVFASMHKSYLTESSEAIVLEPRIQVLNAPTEGSEESFPLHEGTKVEILKTENDWMEIQVNKDSRGWVKAEYLGKI